METGAGLLNEEGGEDVVMFETSVRDVAANTGAELALGEGVGIGVSGVYRRIKTELRCCH